MKEIIEKLTDVKNTILSERGNQKLRFLGLLARVDIDNKWDLLISADWIEKNSSEETLIYVIQKLKEVFNEKLEFISSIVLLTPRESFVRKLARAIIEENKSYPAEIVDLKISADFTVKQVFVIAIDFAGIDLNPSQELEDEPVIIKDMGPF